MRFRKAVAALQLNPFRPPFLERSNLENSLDSNYRVRPARETDLEQIMQLLMPLVDEKLLLKRNEEEVASLLPTGFVASFQPQVNSAELPDESVVGFCAVEVYSKKLAEIQCLGVHASHRSHGLGRILVQQCVDLARDRGVMEVMAISSSEQFLRDIGFDYSLPQQKRALFYQLRSRDAE